MQIFYDHPEGNYTQVPNELLDCPHLQPKQKITWMQLARVCRNGKSHQSIRSLADVARIIGVEPKHFTTDVNRLIKAGGAIKEYGDCKLLIPAEKHEETIQEEVEEQARRKHSLKQEDVWPKVKEAWNKFKPESWMRLDGKLQLPLFIALETQAKRLKIEREDYAKFVGQVCLGGTVDPWWSKQTMKATGVFGMGKVKDTKFENVEKLYKLGANVEVKVDINSDEDVLTKYREAGRTELTKVIRLEAESESAGHEHLQAIPNEEYDDRAAYLYFAPGKPRPVYWTGRNTRKTMYLF